MQRLGLVGGLGPESTIDYYRRIIELAQKKGLPESPSIVIDSLDVKRGLYLSGNDRAGLIDYVLGSVQRLTAAGADFIAIAANTPHLVFDELAAQSKVPIVSIVETCAEEAERRGLNKVLLLGTRFTMEASFYPEVFRKRGIEVIAPEETDRIRVHDRYVNQLLNGVFTDEVRAEFAGLIQRIRVEHGIDGVILGGTELTILLVDSAIPGLQMLDTTALHVAAIVERIA